MDRHPRDDGPTLVGRLFGQYLITEFVDSGGMGDVYKAWDESLRRQVAVKTIRRTLIEDPHAHERFIHEARSASKVRHPFVATVFDVLETGVGPLLIMEYIEGHDLIEILTEDKPDQSTLMRYALEISEGLVAIHEAGLVHRDIKPTNVRVGVDGHIKVLDFGVAGRFQAAELEDSTTDIASTMPGVARGTLAYMSPEQIRGEKVDPRSDLFSLGVVIYEAAVGRHPFLQSTHAATRSAILESPPVESDTARTQGGLGEIALRLLQKKPEQRYQSARELQTDLTLLVRQSGAASLARTVRTPSVWSIPLVIALTAAVAWALIAFTRPPPPPPPPRAPRPAVAVLPFADLTGDDADEQVRGRMVAELITAGLGDFKAFRGVAVDRVVEILGGSSRAGLTERLERVIRDVSPRNLVTGKIYREENDFVCTIDVYTEAGGLVGRSMSVRAPRLTGLARAAVDRLRPALGEPGRFDPAAVPPGSQSDLAQILVQKAQRLFEEIRYAEAVPLLERAVREDPHFVRAFLLLAEVLERSGYEQRAREVITQAVALVGDGGLSGDGRLALEVDAARARIHLETAASVEAYRELVERYPDEPATLLALAEALVAAAAYDDALAAVDRALALDRLAPRLHLERARVLGRRGGPGDFDEALQSIDGAGEIFATLEIPAGAAEADMTRAAILFHHGDYDSAAQAYTRSADGFAAVGLEARAVAVLKSAADVRLVQWRIDDAREVYDLVLPVARATGQYRLIAQTLSSLGAAQYRLGDPDTAERLLREALEELQRIGNEALRMGPALNLAGTLNLVGRTEDAQVLASGALTVATERQHVSNVLIARLRLAESDERDGRFDAARKALEDLDKEQTVPRRRIYVLQALARVCENAELPGCALAAANDAVELAREIGSAEQSAFALASRARQQARLGRLGDAERDLENARRQAEGVQHIPALSHTLKLSGVLVGQLNGKGAAPDVETTPEEASLTAIALRVATAASYLEAGDNRQAATTAAASRDHPWASAADRAVASLVLAEALAADGKLAQAEAEAIRALERAESQRMPLTASKAATLLGTIGSGPGAAGMRERAQEHMDRYLADVPTDRREWVREHGHIARTFQPTGTGPAGPIARR